MNNEKVVADLLTEIGYQASTPEDSILSAIEFIKDNERNGGFPIKDEAGLLMALRRSADARRMEKLNGKNKAMLC